MLDYIFAFGALITGVYIILKSKEYLKNEKIVISGEVYTGEKAKKHIKRLSQVGIGFIVTGVLYLLAVIFK